MRAVLLQATLLLIAHSCGGCHAHAGTEALLASSASSRGGAALTEAVYSAQFALALRSQLPATVLSVAVDLRAYNESAPRHARGYAGLPLARVSALLSREAEGVDLDSGLSAAAAAAATGAETAALCTFLAEVLPWLPLAPCAADAGLDLGSAGVSDPTAISRLGRITASAFEGSTRQLPFAVLPANEVRLGSSEALSWDAGEPLRSDSNASHALLLVLASVATDSPLRGVPLHGQQPGLFFPHKETAPHFGGPLSDELSGRGREWQLAGLKPDGWRPLGLHVSITRGAGGVDAVEWVVKFAETAVREAPELQEPVAAQAVRPSARIGHSGVEAAAEGTGAVDFWLTGGALAGDDGRMSGGSAMVVRSVAGRGFHHMVQVAALLAVDIGEEGLPLQASSKGDSDWQPTCTAAFLQRLEASTYIDLDEVRDLQRAAGRPGVHPLRVRSFGRFIDVERPAYRSTQHTVLFGHEVAVWNSTGSNATAAGEEAVLAEMLRAALDRKAGGAVVTVFAGRRLLLVAALQVQVHKRYARPGCAASKASGSATPRNGNAPHTPVPLHETHTDGSFRATLPPSSAEEVLRTWWRRTQAPARTAAELYDSVVTRERGNETETAPWFSGCYVPVHLPLPTLHLQCTVMRGSRVASLDPLHALAGVLAPARGEWVPVPLAASPASVQPLPYMPTGSADAAAWVIPTTAAAYATAALVICAAAIVAAPGEGRAASSFAALLRDVASAALPGLGASPLSRPSRLL